MKIQAVIFDLDDTLFDDFSCVQAGLEAVIDHYHLPQSTFEKFAARHTEIIHELNPLVWSSEITPQQARVRRFERLLNEHGVSSADGERASQLYREAHRQVWSLLPDTLKVLLNLRERGITTAVLTNYPSEVQIEKVQELGLLTLLDAFLCTDHLPAPKPDARAFSTACTLLNSEPAHTLMVGDSLTADVQGAGRAGLRAVWFNPRHQSNPEGVPEIQELTQVLSLLT